MASPLRLRVYTKVFKEEGKEKKLMFAEVLPPAGTGEAPLHMIVLHLSISRVKVGIDCFSLPSLCSLIF